MEPKPLDQLRAHLIQLGFQRLDLSQRMGQVPPGPGYHEAQQQLTKEYEAADAEFKTTQKQITTRQQGAQPSLF